MSGDGTTSRVGRAAMRYALPGVGVAAVVVAGLVGGEWVREEAPFLLFLIAVAVSAWGVGWGPGVVTVGLAAGASAFFFLEPVSDIRVAAGPDRMRLGLFAFEGLATCALCAALHAARRRLEGERARVRALEGAVLQISDAEQRRIGQDLHDGLGQHLTGVALLAKALERRVGRESPGAAEEAGRVAALADEAVGRARDVARGLSPVELDREGLRPALEHMLGGVTGMAGAQGEVAWEDGVAVADPVVALHLYRIAQEGASNAVKHGKAGRVEVRVGSGEGGGVELTVSDDGIGIAERGPAEGVGGMGLRIMEYRCRLIGGRLRIARGRRGGTVVSCAIPAANGGQHGGE